MTSHTALASVALNDVRRDPDTAARGQLVPAEIDHLAGRAPQSLAGFLALKRALTDLALELDPSTPADPLAFTLDHGPSGEPRVVSAPPRVAARGRLAVSISHTRCRAYGLAVLQEGDVG